MIDFLGYLGAVTGPLGAILLALNIRISPIGYVFFLLSSVSMTVFGLAVDSGQVVLQNGLFTVINLVGLVRWMPNLKAQELEVLTNGHSDVQ